MRNKIKIILIISGIFIFFMGWFSNYFYKTYINPSKEILEIRENSPEYQLINPLLFIDNASLDSSINKSLQSKLEQVARMKIGKDEISNISIYYRDVNTGTWAGFNEEEKYTPSSMLKVAVLIAYLKMASDDPDILLKKLPYTPTETRDQHYKPNQLTPGSKTVRELIQQMIVESDNDATTALDHEHIEEIIKVYKDLEIPNLLSSDDNFMSARLYSRFWRTLYNSTYLSRFYSEEALKLLTYTKFNNGLVGGVSTSTVVAHKFGEHTLFQDEILQKRELHDCGIVYYPEKPYFLCIMTRGKDFKILENVISQISKEVYDYVSKSNNEEASPI